MKTEHYVTHILHNPQEVAGGLEQGQQGLHKALSLEQELSCNWDTIYLNKCRAWDLNKQQKAEYFQRQNCMRNSAIAKNGSGKRAGALNPQIRQVYKNKNITYFEHSNKHKGMLINHQKFNMISSECTPFLYQIK